MCCTAIIFLNPIPCSLPHVCTREHATESIRHDDKVRRSQVSHNADLDDFAKREQSTLCRTVHMRYNSVEPRHVMVVEIV